ncbi:MAG: serine hydrolase [Candidatus Aminicenantes bacterium]|nr:MAG: serine hydrolase [Candidatus Aminicenantes bacterium]
MKKSFVFLVFCGLLITCTCMLMVACKSERDSVTPQGVLEVDKLFSQWDKHDSPGAAIAVIKEGKIIHKNGYGESQLEYNIPITPSTIFHVASVSKQFTAFSIVMLANEGKLSLDDNIHQFIPEVPDFAETITIRHLIHHVSGLRDQWELLAMAGWRLDDVITKEHILIAVRNQEELNFKPGEEYLYCNTGYTLLAEIVERVTGQSFPEWTKENLFQPLGMSNTHFHDDHQMIVKNRAYSYAPSENSGFKKRVLSYANVGATSLFTTVEDLSKWANNFFTKKVGGPLVIAQMEQQGVLNSGEKIDYAFGVSIGKYKGLKTVSHSGGDAGFRSHLLLFPDQKFAVAVLSNCGNINTGQLARQTSEVYLGNFMEEELEEVKTSERKVVDIPSSVLEVYEGKYELADGTILVLTKEGDRLMAEHPAAPEKIQLFPEAMAKFFIKEANAQVHFHPEKDGYVERLTLFMEGNEIKGKRIKIKELTPEQMQGYTGDYYSRELGTFYKIILQDNKLLARHRRHGDIPLVLNKKDLFTGRKWFFQKVRFVRNEKQEISEFLLTGGRVRNLRFIKQP